MDLISELILFHMIKIHGKNILQKYAEFQFDVQFGPVCQWYISGGYLPYAFIDFKALVFLKFTLYFFKDRFDTI